MKIPELVVPIVNVQQSRSRAAWLQSSNYVRYAARWSDSFQSIRTLHLARQGIPSFDSFDSLNGFSGR